ncbi:MULTISPECIES: hypothetical protein [unclassified Arcicella]|uniref:hypothetical protein n=1 Tax=unclassified Arcicella TaxID=2644986 RepID=UPI00285AB497|nr:MULTISPECIES: hypothetical protein [unclassified Arcicella]MDR6565013.1 hypothetical protein [Arcicella sp. BE51]MDR6814808.1 hypothetical protein [Arcicella sp. BE140]MDR6826254.1 hypothetical protein [Arcicella sp. BE139]
MKKYTFVTEYKGGTYIQQICADDILASIRLWIDKIEQFNIPSLGTDEKVILESEFLYERPTKIEGIENVWFIYFSVKKNQVLVNIIATQ